jgi:cobyrinic acid a,c-diamide synthase
MTWRAFSISISVLTGYASVQIDGPCPFFANGSEIRGHEFHYSGPLVPVQPEQTCMAVGRGFGLGNRRDGLVKNNTLACYLHLNALGTPAWSEAVVRRAQEYHAQFVAEDDAPVRTRTEEKHTRIALSTAPVNG